MKKRILSILLALVTILAYVPVAYADEQGQYKDDDFAMKSFQTLYEDGTFAPGSDVKVDKDVDPRGILVSGKNTVLSSKTFSLGKVNFGTEKLQRIQVDAVAEIGSHTKIMVYLDGSSVPAAVFTVPNQKSEGNWKVYKNQNVDVTSLGITGSHSVSIGFCQYYKNGNPKDSGTCKVLLKSIQFVKPSIPVMNIELDESIGTVENMNSDHEHQTMCFGDITLTVPDGYKCKYGNYTGGTYELEYIRGRGNSTWDSQKKPYKIKLDKSADLFNMGSNKHWALLANDFDPTLIHNRVTYAMGEDLGMAFTPQGVPVDVIMNGDYLGSYYLCENIRVDKNRVDIDNLEDDSSDITGGYLLGTAFYGADPGAYLFKTDAGVEFNVTSPDAASGDFSKENEYIEKYIQRVENALMGKKNPETGKVENPFDFIDLDSAVEYYLIQEMSQNGDFFGTGSTYCYKIRNGKLYWGPLWDFDLAYYFGDDPDDFYGNSWMNQRDWFQLMLSYPEYQEALKKYWKEKLEPELMAVTADGGMIDQYTQELVYSAANNSTSAKPSTSNLIFDIDEWTPKTTAGEIETFKTECDRFKKQLRLRTEWMSNNLDSIGIPVLTIKFKNEGKTVLTSKIYGGVAVGNYPKEPVSKDPNKIFKGWYFTYAGSNGYEQIIPIKDMQMDLVNFAKKTGGNTVVNAEAVFVDKSQDNTVKKVYFEKSKYQLGIDKSLPASYTIPFSTGPDYADINTIKWTVENKDILKVDANYSGLTVYPKAAGTTKITATTKEGKKYSVTVKLVGDMARNEWNHHLPYSFKLASSKVTMAMGSSKGLKIRIIEPDDYLDIVTSDMYAYNWYSTDLDTVEATAGCLKGKKVGTATIIVQNSSTREMAYCTVVVKPKKATVSKASKTGSNMTVRMKTKVSKTGGSKYQVAYRVKGTKDWKKVSTSKQTASMSVTAGKTYQVKTRAYKTIDGKTYYGSWSSIKTVQ